MSAQSSLTTNLITDSQLTLTPMKRVPITPPEKTEDVSSADKIRNLVNGQLKVPGIVLEWDKDSEVVVHVFGRLDVFVTRIKDIEAMTEQTKYLDSVESDREIVEVD